MPNAPISRYPIERCPITQVLVYIKATNKTNNVCIIYDKVKNICQFFNSMPQLAGTQLAGTQLYRFSCILKFILNAIPRNSIN